MYFTAFWFPRLSHVTFYSEHVMANVGKTLLCACDSHEVTMDKTDKTVKTRTIDGIIYKQTRASH